MSQILNAILLRMKKKLTSLQTFLHKMTALSLVTVLFGMMLSQTFHQHLDSTLKSKQSSISISKLAEHCKVCDHFHHHSGPAITPDFITLAIALNPIDLKSVIRFEEVDSSNNLDGYINKGPPALF